MLLQHSWIAPKFKGLKGNAFIYAGFETLNYCANDKNKSRKNGEFT